jgi:hypothetical protein
MFTAEILKKVFQQMKEEEVEASMTAIAYYPHITRIYEEAATTLPMRSLDRLAEILNEHTNSKEKS